MANTFDPEGGLIVTSPKLTGDDVRIAQRTLLKNVFEEDFLESDVDGIWGLEEKRATLRAKEAIGYRPSQIGPAYGSILHGYLTGEEKIDAAMRERRQEYLRDERAGPPKARRKGCARGGRHEGAARRIQRDEVRRVVRDQRRLLVRHLRQLVLRQGRLGGRLPARKAALVLPYGDGPGRRARRRPRPDPRSRARGHRSLPVRRRRQRRPHRDLPRQDRFGHVQGDRGQHVYHLRQQRRRRDDSGSLHEPGVPSEPAAAWGSCASSTSFRGGRPASIMSP